MFPQDQIGFMKLSWMDTGSLPLFPAKGFSFVAEGDKIGARSFPPLKKPFPIWDSRIQSSTEKLWCNAKMEKQIFKLSRISCTAEKTGLFITCLICPTPAALI